MPAVKKVAENSRYPVTARAGVLATPRRRRAAAMTTVSTKASRSRSPCRSEFHPAMKMHTTPRPPPRLTREPT